MPGREYKQPERMDGLENLWGGCRQEPFSPPERLLPDLVLNCCVPLFARPDPHRGFDRNDKYLSVTVSSRLCRRNNELHDFAGVAVAYYHLDFHLGQKSSRSLIASQRLEPTFCLPKPLTSVTAIPPIPISAKACWTASNLKGLMTASIFFIKADRALPMPV